MGKTKHKYLPRKTGAITTVEMNEQKETDRKQLKRAKSFRRKAYVLLRKRNGDIEKRYIGTETIKSY